MFRREKLTKYLRLLGGYVQKNMFILARIPGLYTLLQLANKLFSPPITSGIRTNGVDRPPNGSIKGDVDWLIVVPQSMNPAKVAWSPGAGNYFFEILESGKEVLPNSKFEVHFIEPEDENWIEKLSSKIAEISPRNVLMQGEEQPNKDPRALEMFFSVLKKISSCRMVLVFYDSVYWWHTINFDRYATIYPNMGVVAIDAYPHRIRKAVFRIGPAILPTSAVSLSKLRSQIAQKPKDAIGLSFVGAIYPYRRKSLEKFRESGIEIDLNPHLRNSDGIKPEYVEYCAAFSNSWATINLSRSNGMPIKHLKTRVLEAPMFGTLLITDQFDIPEMFLSPNAYVSFRNAKELRAIIGKLKDDVFLYESIKQKGMRESESLRTVFWELLKNQD